MGFKSFFKSIFGEDEELEALRKKHNIRTGDDDKAGRESQKAERNIPDVWEEIDNYRMNLFLGSWLTRKLRGPGRRAEKLKEDLEKKRAKEREKEEEEGEEE